jgi:molecular chaperone DnaK
VVTSPAPGRVPQIVVNVLTDVNSPLSTSQQRTRLTATTNKDQSIAISSGSGPSESDIKSMLDDDAVKYGETDKVRKAMIEADRNDCAAKDTEKALTGFADKLDKDDTENITENTTVLRDSGIMARQLTEQTDVLQTASLNLFDKMLHGHSGQQRQ